MKQDQNRRRHRPLLFGVIFLFLGASLLLRTTGNLNGVLALWPIVLVFLGVSLLFKVYFRDGRESYVFAGLFLFLAGAFLLIVNTQILDIKLRQIWPFFMLFAGFSLLAYGLKSSGSAKARMMIPALSIILLSAVFLLFSLGVVNVSLRLFVVMWWPAIFVFAGIILIVFDAVSNRKSRS